MMECVSKMPDAHLEAHSIALPVIARPAGPWQRMRRASSQWCRRKRFTVCHFEARRAVAIRSLSHLNWRFHTCLEQTIEKEVLHVFLWNHRHLIRPFGPPSPQGEGLDRARRAEASSQGKASVVFNAQRRTCWPPHRGGCQPKAD